MIEPSDGPFLFDTSAEGAGSRATMNPNHGVGSTPTLRNTASSSQPSRFPNESVAIVCCGVLLPRRIDPASRRRGSPI